MKASLAKVTEEILNMNPMAKLWLNVDGMVFSWNVQVYGLEGPY